MAKKFYSSVPKCARFDDTTNLDSWLRRHPGERGGLVPRDYSEDPLGSHECAHAGAIVKIPEVEWKERIQEREAKKQRGLDLLATYKMKPLHQGRTWSCWAQAVTDNAHFHMAYAGGPVVRLSTGSVAGPVKNYRKAGGNCIEALKRMCSHGICSANMWPENDCQRNRWNAETAANAALHKVEEFDDLAPRDWEEFISLLLVPGRTVAYCNYAMSHAVLAIDAIIDKRGQIGVLTRNSGLYRDNNGFSQFFGRYAQPDDAVSVRVMSLGYQRTALAMAA